MPKTTKQIWLTETFEDRAETETMNWYSEEEVRKFLSELHRVVSWAECQESLTREDMFLQLMEDIKSAEKELRRNEQNPKIMNKCDKK